MGKEMREIIGDIREEWNLTRDEWLELGKLCIAESGLQQDAEDKTVRVYTKDGVEARATVDELIIGPQKFSRVM